ncbi:MAG: Crp/Fnr family transcriptional regulator [Elusimicrobia bacterium]|nr:Crp/Fnr family transcriptional regulator [Elusimicrobiota bacterium]
MAIKTGGCLKKHFIECPIGKLDFFAGISADELKEFCRYCIPNAYAKRNALFYAGNNPLGLYFLCLGRVNIWRAGSLGRRQVVRVAKAPDIIGYRAFFSQEPYSATGEVVVESHICFLERAAFERTFGSSIGFFRWLTKYMAEKLREAEEKELKFILNTVEERLADFLLSAGRGEARRVAVLPQFRHELAAEIGTSPETVSRILASFAERNLIKILAKKQIVLLDPIRLERIARR